MSDKELLKLALDTQAARDNDPELTDNLCLEIKQSAIFNFNWQDLLQSAPIAISATGACYAACFSTDGARIQLEPPLQGAFKHLGYCSLSANLIQCGDTGRKAFVKAQTNFAFVKQTSVDAQNKAGKIIEIIGDPQAAKTMLKPTMDTLKAISDDCYEKVTEIEKHFDDWLDFARELHAACAGTDSSAEEKLRATEIDLAVQHARFDSQKSTVDEAKIASDKFGKQLDVASEAFKKASEGFPSGWDIVGQQIVGGLADCLTGSLTSLVQNFTMNPIAKVSSGVSTFNNLIHPKKDGQDNSAGDGSGAKPPAAPKVPVPPYSTDPAYSFVQKDMIHLYHLNAILTTGKDGGVDWDGIVGGTATPTESIDFVSKMLQDAAFTFASLATADPPSKELANVLDAASKIATAVRDQAVKDSKMGKKFLDADSSTVKDWHGNFQTQYSAAQKMMAVAKSLPGVTAGGMPLMANGPDPNVQIAQTNAKTTQAQATLEAAKNRLTTTQDGFMKTQDNFLKASELLLEQQNRMTEIQGALMQLNQSKLSLTEIKDVLEHCILLIVNVKKNITNLCTFFQAMSVTVEAVVKHTVSGFLQQIAGSVSGGNDMKVFRVGQYTLSDLQRSILFQAAVTIRGYFSLFGDIASMWGKLSEDYITPGVQMLDDLSIAEKDLAKRQQMLGKLQSWAIASVEGVGKIAKDTKQGILENMAGRLDGIKAVTKRLPPSEPMKKAIVQGTEETKKAADEALEANAAAKPLNRFAPRMVKA